MAEIEHGTYGGAQKCRRRPEGSCVDCRRAAAAYMREHRREHPAAYAREKRLTSAQSRALWRLADMHPGLFRALTDEELSKDEAAA